MNAAIRILFLEDEVLDFELVTSILEEQGLVCAFTHVNNRKSFEEALAAGGYDIILSDYSVPGYGGSDALRLVRSKSPFLPFILLSGTLSEEQAVESLKAGATDYIIKQRLHRLGPAILRALEEAREKAERAEVEAALQESSARIREQAALLDKARDAIILVDMQQRILYWNKSAERIFGWAADEVINRRIDEFMIPSAAAGGGDAFPKLIAESEWRGELPVKTKAGSRIIVESRWSVMRDADAPEPKGILLINTDVTEKKEIEAQFLRAQRIETIGALSGGIAHDLNNALSPIIMATELLGDDVKSESGQRMLEMVRSSGKRCADMVKQILTFSRGAGQNLERVDCCKIVEELAALARETFPRLITVESRCDKPLDAIQGNITQLHQVIMNLLVNARDAMPRGGMLRLQARNVALHNKEHRMLRRPASGAFVSIQVTDTGTGIPPAILDRIFEPFFTTKEVGKGTGLGLSTVFSIVKAHGGFVELRSEVGKGTAFELFFPAFRAVEKEQGVVQPMSKPAAGERLLLVDDQAGLLAILKNTLETFGYHVETASDGLAALDVLEKNPDGIDLILTDWVMPLMSGADLVRRMRAAAPRARIIVASGSGFMEGDKFNAMLVEGALEKPYGTETLLKEIRRVLTAPLNAAGPISQGDLALKSPILRSGEP